MSKSVNFRTGIQRYIPQLALDEVCRLIDENSFFLKITRPRKTKKGDFRPDIRGNFHRISVNGDLNQYDFLITLIHEYAHLIVWLKHGRSAKPHGIEWKNEFRNHLLPFFELNVFPLDLKNAVLSFISNPAASSCVDIHLQKSLAKYNKHQTLYLEDIKEGQLFVFDKNRLFEKGKRLRKRYQCEEVNTKKKYLFSPIAEVELYQASTES